MCRYSSDQIDWDSSITLHALVSAQKYKLEQKTMQYPMPNKALNMVKLSQPV